MSKGIEFSGEGWDFRKRLVRLKIDGKKVLGKVKVDPNWDLPDEE